MKRVDEKNLVENPYSLKYRIFKTLLMILAWVSFGMNNQLLSTSLEDLKIFLNVDYQHISMATVSRITGYMICNVLCSFFLDRLNKKSDLMMAIAKIIIILRKLATS